VTPPSVDGPGEETFAQRLRRLRLARGLSQRAVSEPGISYAYVSRLESGQRQPSVKAIRRLAARLGVSPEYLETGRDVDAAEELELRLGELELELRLAEGGIQVLPRLRELLPETVAAGDSALSSRTASVLGQAALAAGDHAEAVSALEQATRAGELSPRLQPQVYASLARAYVSSGRTDDAVELLEGCLTELEQAGDDEALTYARFAIFLSYALQARGDLPRAREALGQALERTESVVDSYTLVRLYWSQARLCAAEGEPKRALASLRRAIALLEATEDSRQLGRAHLLYAEILTGDGAAEPAARHLALAEELLGSRPEAEDLYWLRAEQARQAARSGEPEHALALAQEALELIGDSDPSERATALLAVAEARLALGDATAARTSFAEGLALLEGERLWHEAAESARTFAQLLQAAGSSREAADLFERASELALRSHPRMV
jgi:transcriptional regulator with XRE-family HTH domain